VPDIHSTSTRRRSLTAEHGFALIRITFGLVYLSNAIAKITNLSDVHFGPLSGTLITQGGARGILERAIDGTWFPLLGALYENLVLSHWAFFGWFLAVAELLIAVALLAGAASRLAALAALALIGPIWLLVLGQGGYLWTYPVELLPLIALSVAPSGRVWGLDRRIQRDGKRSWPF